MTSGERVLTTFASQESDRVPINYSANPGIDARLKDHFGLEQSDDEGLRAALGVYFRGVGHNTPGQSYTKISLNEEFGQTTGVSVRDI